MDQCMAGGLALLQLLLLIKIIMSIKLFTLHDAKSHAVAAHTLLGCTGLSGRNTGLTALQRQPRGVAKSAGGAARHQPSAHQGAGAGRHGASSQPGHPICKTLSAFRVLLQRPPVKASSLLQCAFAAHALQLCVACASRAHDWPASQEKACKAPRDITPV